MHRVLVRNWRQAHRLRKEKHTRTNDEGHLLVFLLDKRVQVDTGQNQPRTGSLVSKQPQLDILRLCFAFEQDIVVEEDHGRGDTISRTTNLVIT